MSELLSTSEAEALRDEATSMINSVGSSISVKTKTGTSYDIDTGTTVPTYETSTIKADISTFESNELSNLVIVGDLKLMITSDDIAKMTQGTILTIDDFDYSIKNIMPEIKKDIKMYAIVQARK